MAIKSVNGLAWASMKARNGLARASIKSVNGLAAPAGGAPFGGLVSTTDLVDWWPLDEASGNAIGLHAGLDLTDNNTVTAGTGGPGSSNYRVFTRANSESFSRASEAAFQFGTGDFSVGCWFRTTNTNPLAGADQNTILGKHYTSFELFNYGGYIGGYCGGATNSVGAIGTTPVSNNTWYHLVLQRSGTELQLWINGTKLSTSTNSANADTANALSFGVRPGPSGWLDADVNRAFIFKGRALSSGEISALYNSGNGLDY